jgi:hypothetical protein
MGNTTCHWGAVYKRLFIFNTSAMSIREQYYIHQQLEPNEKLIAGNAKRYTPAFIEKNKFIARLIEEMGIEAYRAKVAEDAERERRNFEY